jgi:uncharacterized protein YodC (DUF2158 family)
MEVKKFSLGSKVKLKTGSPEMTVVGYEAEFGENVERKFNRMHRKFNLVMCRWTEDNETRQATFNVNILEAVKNSSMPGLIGIPLMVADFMLWG